MRISGFTLEKVNGRARASAQIAWEDSQRADAEVFIETDADFSSGLSCNPHAFLLACLAPAMRYGERRLYLDAELCPVLKDGVATATAILHDWFYRGKRPPIQVEARSLMHGLAAPAAERAAFFFSGGIDSYASLSLNRLSFPHDHPYSIKDGILVYGLEQDDPEKFEHVKEHLGRAADACGISLVPVYTNMYLPYRQEDAPSGYNFWQLEFMGLALASVAHAFSPRLSRACIASTDSHRTLRPHGSHPLLDPSYSSSDMTILHTGIALTRLEKTRVIAEWGPPLRYLRVCNLYQRYRRGAVNCGECEKCLRTKLALLALDTLQEAAVFSNPEVTVEMVERRVRLTTAYKMACYEELIEPLAARGHARIARALSRKVTDYRRRGPWTPRGTDTLRRRALRKLASLVSRENGG